jgi:hypothetical protein
MKKVLPTLGVPREKVRLHLRHRLLQPLPVLHEHLRHAQHPRPRAGVATGLKSPPDLQVWVITGDGDGCRSAATT